MADIFAKINELEKLKKDAVKDLLKQRGDIDRQLAKLGYITEGKAKLAKPLKKRTRSGPTKPCKVCGEMGHDARKHRFEAKKKK